MSSDANALTPSEPESPPALRRYLEDKSIKTRRVVWWAITIQFAVVTAYQVSIFTQSKSPVETSHLAYALLSPSPFLILGIYNLLFALPRRVRWVEVAPSGSVYLVYGRRRVEWKLSDIWRIIQLGEGYEIATVKASIIANRKHHKDYFEFVSLLVQMNPRIRMLNRKMEPTTFSALASKEKRRRETPALHA